MNAQALRVEEQAAPYLVAPVLTDQLDTFATAPDGFKRLRELVLNLAVRGRLVPQDPSDEPAEKLLGRIKAAKIKLNSRQRLSDGKPEAPYELPAGWVWTSLGEAGITNPRNEANDQLEASFVPMAMIPASLGIPHSQEVRSWREIKNGFTHFAENDVGVAKITPCFENGKSCVFRNLKSGVGAGTTELHVFRPIGGYVLPEFVLVYLKNPSFLRNGEQVMTGSAGQKRLPRSFFEESPFPLPPLAEQSRIVAKVEEQMALIDRLEAKVSHGETARGKLLDALLTSLADSPDAAATADAWAQLAPHFDLLLQTPADVDRLQQTLLTLAVKGRLVPQDPNDEPAAELLKRIRAEKDRLVAEGKIRPNKSISSFSVDEQSFVLPSGWRWAQFGEVSICRDGERIPVSSEERAKRNKVYDYYGASGVIDKIDGYLFDGTLLLIGEDGANLINRSTPIAFLAQGKFWVNNHAHVIDGLGVGLLDYLCLFINAISLEPYVTGTAQPKMNQAKLNSIPIALPPAAEQRRIVAAVASLTALCDRLRERLAARRELSAKLAAALTESALA